VGERERNFNKVKLDHLIKKPELAAALVHFDI
jgi:hypothetical protein